MQFEQEKDQNHLEQSCEDQLYKAIIHAKQAPGTTFNKVDSRYTAPLKIKSHSKDLSYQGKKRNF